MKLFFNHKYYPFLKSYITIICTYCQDKNLQNGVLISLPNKSGSLRLIIDYAYIDDNKNEGLEGDGTPTIFKDVKDFLINNVSITGFNYGGVLANGGNVEVINLHLGNNGTGANNGIEIAKGASATNNPTLTMNGVLTSDTTENVIRVAENDSLTEFTIENTTNTTNKIVLTSEKIVLTDQYNNVVAESAQRNSFYCKSRNNDNSRFSKIS